MDHNFIMGIELSNNPQLATKTITEIMLLKTYPMMILIRQRLQSYNGPLTDEEFNKIHSVFVLCCSQIRKCFQTLLSIFKMEHKEHVVLQETRQCILERLSWCVNRLHTIEVLLANSDGNIPDEQECSLMMTQIHFVNWIDHTFEELTKLADIIYKTDSKESEDTYKLWKTDVIECVSDLHITIEELLLSAMTLCRYCLPADQHVVKARCQVVLRESKALISELFEGETDDTFKASLETLKLPINPSNVNVLIDVLKDVLNALETNTNTALLSLLIHCFSYDISPVDVLKNHLKETCSCEVKCDDDVTEHCSFVKEFDVYNERLLQIGSFAVSCSSDQKRTTPLRSGLASLEALDPHLVPALTLAPEGPHADLLMESWRLETKDVRDGVFLIVDPAAFAEKSKQMIHEMLVTILKKPQYNNADVCAVINIGCVVRDFFGVYGDQEPDALGHYEQLGPLLDDLDKVQMECKIVSNLLSTGQDYTYDVKHSKNKTATLEQLTKRLKLLYTIVGRINSLLHPKENEDQLFECETEEDEDKNYVTQTIYQNNAYTYINSPRRQGSNFSRSIFARTHVTSSTRNFPLSKLTKHLKAKRCDEINFSVQLDELFNLTDVNNPKSNVNTSSKLVNKYIELGREPSVLYNFSSKKRASLRKLVISKHFKMQSKGEFVGNFKESVVADDRNLMDDSTSLQITEILNQMSDMTQAFSTAEIRSNAAVHNGNTADSAEESIHKLSIQINKPNTSISKHIWNIPVNSSVVEVPTDESCSNITEPSNVSTLERVKDIRLLESKLKSLKYMEETSL